MRTTFLNLLKEAESKTKKVKNKDGFKISYDKNKQEIIRSKKDEITLIFHDENKIHEITYITSIGEIIEEKDFEIIDGEKKSKYSFSLGLLGSELTKGVFVITKDGKPYKYGSSYINKIFKQKNKKFDTLTNEDKEEIIKRTMILKKEYERNEK